MKKQKVFGIGRLVKRNRIPRRMGLDSSMIIALMDERDEYSLYRPKIFDRKNVLWINHVVFGEVLGHLIHEEKKSKDESFQKLSGFLRKNNIGVLAKSRIDMDKVNLTFEELKQHRAKIKNDAGDKDLLIISIYKVENIDCIVNLNYRHFQPYCQHLGIDTDSPMRDVDKMMRQVFGWRKRK